jgi:hypothetical protein
MIPDCQPERDQPRRRKRHRGGRLRSEDRSTDGVDVLRVATDRVTAARCLPAGARTRLRAERRVMVEKRRPAWASDARKPAIVAGVAGSGCTP